MSNEKQVPLETPKWKDLKDIYLAKKQGEALERITKPLSHEESLGLGYYGPQTVLALGAVDLLEDALNEIVKMGMTKKVTLKDENENEIEVEVPDLEEQQRFMETKHYHLLHTFTAEIGVASGSREAKRMEKGLETIGQLGQYLPFSKHTPLQPEKLDLNE